MVHGFLRVLAQGKSFPVQKLQRAGALAQMERAIYSNVEDIFTDVIVDVPESNAVAFLEMAKAAGRSHILKIRHRQNLPELRRRNGQ